MTNFVRNDPYKPDGAGTYECMACGTRETAESQPVGCPDCGAAMRNLAVPRDE
jgi:rubrerythrin